MSDDIRSVSVKTPPKVKPKHKAEDVVIDADEFWTSAFNTSSKITKYWLSVFQTMTAIQDSTTKFKVQLEKLGIEFVDIDETTSAVDLTKLVQIKQYDTMIRILGLPDEQRKQLMQNYIDARTLPQQRKQKSDLEKLTDQFNSLIGQLPR